MPIEYIHFKLFYIVCYSVIEDVVAVKRSEVYVIVVEF